MRILHRVFILLAVTVTFVLFFISLFSNYYSTVISQFDTRVCDNLPPRQYVHPVFIATGPPIGRDPQPLFEPQFTKNSSLIKCNQIIDKTLLIIHSHAKNSIWRDFQRKQITKSWLDINNVIMIFVVAVHNDTQILAEMKEHGDIIEGDFEESYHMMSYKAMLWINAIASCPWLPNLVVKIDDDVAVDLIGLKFLIKRYSKVDNFIACRVFPHGTVVRNPKSKWFLSKEEYKFNDLGTYCQGMAYLISGNLLITMQKNIKLSQTLWMDDWYVTRGLIRDYKMNYYALDQHILSTNSDKELEYWLKNINRKKHRVIFAHFRPAETFSIKRHQSVWSEIINYNNRCRT